MIVCSCHRVSDADLRHLAHAGASEGEVARLTAAGTACGCCASMVREVLARERGGCGKSNACPGCTSRSAH